MKKILLTLIIMATCAANVFAAKVPDNVKNLVKKDFAQADFRFDGLITLPDGTLYLPLYPALVKKPEKLEVRSTIPANKTLTDKPEVVILNNDFVFLKILTDQKGRKTVLNIKEPPIEVRTGLLPQDMLVPTGLIIPDNIKGIIGNLQIPTAQDAGLRIKAEPFLEHKTVKTSQATKNLVSKVPQLQNKTLYIATCYSKNIQVVQNEESQPEYALAQKAIPIDIKATPDDKFLLVTTYSKTFVDVISLADERVIKQIDLTAQPAEIVIDKLNNRAYISSGSTSSIYIIDLNTMVLKQKIKVKGMCQKLYLSDDGTKLFYVDKKTNDVWAIELDNEFVIKNIGSFPNVSRIAFTQGKIYITSRTKNRLAIVDYVTMGLIKEIDVEAKPIDMLVYKDNLYVLSAQNNVVQVINTVNDEITDTVHLNTAGFSTKIYRIKNTNIALVTDTKTDKYSVLDLDKKQVIKTNILEIPVSEIVVVPTVKKINR
ncbi:MAG: YncE family protein [Candidatus Gastranaerophilaceae bacterium]